MQGGCMDRRQRKTREAIFGAFTALLSKKDFHQITVGEIIDRANVGRATFYAHFETKDFLLKELCEELFAHVFEAELGMEQAHTHIFDCDVQGSVFLHLLQHFKKDDNHILQLLTCQNNALFLEYFQQNLKELVKQQLPLFEQRRGNLPQDFWIRHICATFVETVRWWLDSGMKETPEVIAQYFLAAV